MESGQQYELTGMVLPLAELVEAADRNGTPEDEELLKITDRVINTALTAEQVRLGKSGINLFWGYDDFQRDYNEEDFSALKSAYYRLILRYPSVFMKERWKTFIQSVDLLMDTTTLHRDMDNPNHAAFSHYPLAVPLSDGIRTAVINILEARRISDNTQKLPVYGLIYSAFITICILAAAVVCMLAGKRYIEALLLLTSLIKVPLIFLTAPSRLFMYYYPAYLTGYFVLFLVIYILCNRAGEGAEILQGVCDE
ncbi:MAG: hypothetical protein J5842_06350 [Lachnospiraceae bacterium]|nr:hypothetical protein [Lachnospiraceae bacterium]